MHYITNTLAIRTHFISTNDPHKLAGCELHNLLDNNKQLRTHLHLENPVAVIEYLIIQQFSGETTLITNDKNPHDSSIIDLFKEYLTCLVLQLTIEDHEANRKLHLHRKIAANMEIAFKKNEKKSNRSDITSKRVRTTGQTIKHARICTKHCQRNKQAKQEENTQGTQAFKHARQGQKKLVREILATEQQLFK